MNKLNLGCGKDIRKDCINMDKLPLKGVDVIHNLNVVPYPFKENTFDTVYIYGVMEHLPDTIQVMEEIHRISKPNAQIYISVPFWNCTNMYTDPTHCKFFSYNTFNFFKKTHSHHFYTKAEFKILNIKVTGIRLLPRFLRILLSHNITNVVVRLDYEIQVIK